MVKLIYNDHEVILRNYRARDFIGVFVNEDYELADVKGKTVIDCGAAIGDSSIYFALKGAKRVISFEAYPSIAKIAEQNIKLNDIENVLIVNAACGKDETMLVDPRLGGGPTPLIRVANGAKIPSYSLKSIIQKFQIEEGSVLKIDCEGCEYDFILREDETTLAYFSQIIMEYHHGYNELKKKLEKAGFRVKVSKPVLCHNTFGKLILGKLYAYKD
ncbi:FkbM family methyltransferase [Sulfurisphaera tokodaii]|uniref:Methyltransferase FkbM domain-containing protein n=2 Tax=Sulfurisphaera tokodaii TaxID=111955 RepID=Q96Z67_SULTO|nr:FkbM family methyltransferase [Sulfurisphaera tokodaii]BAB67059.1 hypothetical protein STK_19640 [Sulfurisphaera tokodaii str. 7]